MVCKEQKKEYTILFKKYFLKTFVSRLTDYSEPKIDVVSAEKKNEKYTIVSSILLATEKRAEVKIDWRVYTKDPDKPLIRDLIIEGSETRRKFIDSVISQSDKNYLNNLINYNKVLSQRNALLKYFALNNTFNAQTLHVYNEQLQTYGTEIFKTRHAFLETFIPIFKQRYDAISNNKEDVSLSYKSDLFDNDLNTLLKENINKDKALQYTSVGIHKDDLNFEIDTFPIKKFGSQGQQKSFLVALKLAQFDFIKQQSGVPPILLLDDIFDKLDENRVAQIIELVDNKHFGQLFISDTHADRTENVVKQTHQSYKIFKL